MRHKSCTHLSTTTKLLGQSQFHSCLHSENHSEHTDMVIYSPRAKWSHGWWAGLICPGGLTLTVPNHKVPFRKIHKDQRLLYFISLFWIHPDLLCLYLIHNNEASYPKLILSYLHLLWYTPTATIQELRSQVWAHDTRLINTNSRFNFG